MAEQGLVTLGDEAVETAKMEYERCIDRMRKAGVPVGNMHVVQYLAGGGALVDGEEAEPGEFYQGNCISLVLYLDAEEGDECGGS